VGYSAASGHWLKDLHPVWLDPARALSRRCGFQLGWAMASSKQGIQCCLSWMMLYRPSKTEQPHALYRLCRKALTNVARACRRPLRWRRLVLQDEVLQVSVGRIYGHGLKGQDESCWRWVMRSNGREPAGAALKSTLQVPPALARDCWWLSTISAEELASMNILCVDDHACSPRLYQPAGMTFSQAQASREATGRKRRISAAAANGAALTGGVCWIYRATAASAVLKTG